MFRKTFLYYLAALLLTTGNAYAVNVATWTFVDGNGVDGVNKSATRDATSPQITSFNKNFYAIWTERDATNSVRQVRVAVYNELDLTPAWSFVDGNGITGINKDTSQGARDPQLTVLGRKLYATWREDNGTADQIRVAVYNGLDLTPAWTFVDGNGVNGINKDATLSAGTPQLVARARKLYATWRESNGTVDQIRVAVYNGLDLTPAWTFVDGNGVNGINKDATKNASRPQLTVARNRLYATWTEINSQDQIRVAVYNGLDLTPAWTFVDGNGVNGINKDTGRDAAQPQFAFFRGKIYMTWTESNGSDDQLRVAMYNGNDLLPVWTFMDGNGANGLNRDVTYSASSPQLVMHRGVLYAMWSEDNGTADQIRAAAFSGNVLLPAWTFVDGNSATTGLNKNTGLGASVPQFARFSNKLYATWVETNGTNTQIRVILGQ